MIANMIKNPSHFAQELRDLNPGMNNAELSELLADAENIPAEYKFKVLMTLVHTDLLAD